MHPNVEFMRAKLAELQGIPNTCPVNGAAPEEEGLTSCFYDGPPYQGRPTRVFARYALPQGASAEHPVPGIVLIHGGMGSVYADWIRAWLEQGIAVIAMDTCGSIPVQNKAPEAKSPWLYHECGGPAGWGRYAATVDPVEDQWMFHAVVAVLNAANLLASLPGVDASNIGWMGISWGAVIGCISSGLIPEFRFAVPVYGCGGFNTPESCLDAPDLSMELRAKWFELWDPDHFLHYAKCPFLWQTGTNDIAFPHSCWRNSTNLPQNMNYCSLRYDYVHGHDTPRYSKTIFDFVKSTLAGELLPSFCPPVIRGNNISTVLDCAAHKIKSVKLWTTRALGPWMDRRWNSQDVTPEDNGNITASLPVLTTSAFFQCEAENGTLWSSTTVDKD